MSYWSYEEKGECWKMGLSICCLLLLDIVFALVFPEVCKVSNCVEPSLFI